MTCTYSSLLYQYKYPSRVCVLAPISLVDRKFASLIAILMDRIVMTRFHYYTKTRIRTFILLGTTEVLSRSPYFNNVRAAEAQYKA